MRREAGALGARRPREVASYRAEAVVAEAHCKVRWQLGAMEKRDDCQG
jgi:hypothetical protein